MLRRGRQPDPDELVIASAYGTAVARIPGAIRQELRYLCTRLDVHGGGLPASIAVTSSWDPSPCAAIGTARPGNPPPPR